MPDNPTVNRIPPITPAERLRCAARLATAWLAAQAPPRTPAATGR